MFQAPVGKRLPPSLQLVGWSDAPPLPNPLLTQFSLARLGIILAFGLFILLGTIFIIVLTSGNFFNAPGMPESTSTLIPTRILATPTLFLVGGTERPTLEMPTTTPTLLVMATQPELTPTLFPLTQTPTLVSASPTSCAPPTGWVIYTVQAGDTLFFISTATGTTVAQLQDANCLGATTQIITGQRLYVPKLPAFPTTPPPLATETMPSTDVPAYETITPTDIPTLTETPAPTSTVSEQPTDITEPTLSPTSTINPGN
ncbi:MAG: hypothetical protein Fur0022_23570 [Anaerolineales bacterium]